MVVSSYPLYSGVIGSGQRWSSSLSRPPTKKEHKDRQACVYVCMREKNPCEPVRTGAHQIPDARDVTMQMGSPVQIRPLETTIGFFIPVYIVIIVSKCCYPATTFNAKKE